MRDKTLTLLYPGIIKELLSKWPELCKVCNSSNTSPLYLAAAQGHLDIVNAILDADVSSARIVRKNGKTALHNAARYGLVPIVKALIERDPEIVSIKDKKGQTALHMAVKGHDTSVIEEILDAEHSILNERDKKGNTALHIATRKVRPQVKSTYLYFLDGKPETAYSCIDFFSFSCIIVYLFGNDHQNTHPWDLLILDIKF